MSRLRILGFDTVLDACSAAVWDDGAVTSARQVRRAGHAEALVPMIERVMAEAAMTYGDLDAVAVTRGPGSFTGLRIGLAAARGIGLAAAVPVLGLNSLEVVAFAALGHVDGAEPIMAVLDARRESVYAQGFEKDDRDLKPLFEPVLMAISDLADLASRDGGIVVGNGVPVVEPMVSWARWRTVPVPGTPDAASLAALAAVRIAHHGTAAINAPPAPLYLRSPDAKLPARG